LARCEFPLDRAQHWTEKDRRHARHADRLKHIEQRSDGNRKLTELHDEIELSLIAAERQHINELYRSGMLKDEARRRIERELDLREVDLANQQSEE
jgi:monovalent cation/hydrogen antiporter